MIIARITPLIATVNQVVTDYVATITFDSVSSSSNVVINSYEWNTLLSSGSGFLNPNTNGTSLPAIQTPTLSLSFNFLTVSKIILRLTVTDSENKQSIQTAVITHNSNTLNPEIYFRTIEVNPILLPQGLTEFRTTVVNKELISDSFITNVFTTLHFDREYDGIINQTGAINTVFSSTYQEECNFNTTYISGTGGSITSNEVFNTVMFNLVIQNAQDLVIQLSNECKIVDLYSQTKSYIDQLTGRTANNSMRYLEITAMVNCCKSEKIVHKLAPKYTFEITPSQCVDTGQVFVDPLGNEYEVHTMTITITGINSGYVGSVAYDGIMNPNTNKLELQLLTFYVPIAPAPDNAQPHVITITTIDNFVYTINIDYQTIIGLCEKTPVITSVEYPEYPCGLITLNSINETRIILNSHFFNYSECDTNIIPLPDGIYYFQLNNSGLSNQTISNCKFFNCQTYCMVVKAIANKCNLFIKPLYDALVYADNCDIVTCEEKCYMYEILRGYLSECDCLIYENENKLPDLNTGCGCNDK